MSTMPPNATPLLRALDAATARITRIPAGRLAELCSPDDCPPPLLPWLAWAASVDRWDGDWPEAVQREAIRQSRRKHELRGTWAAVRAEMEIAGAVWDWSEGPDPMTGTVTIRNGASIHAAGIAGLRARLDAVKRASFHLGVVFEQGIRAEIALGFGLSAISAGRIDVAREA